VIPLYVPLTLLVAGAVCWFMTGFAACDETHPQRWGWVFTFGFYGVALWVFAIIILAGRW
jgi:hypothetical protein